MATRRAIANGNWSATGTWNGGVVPTAGDTVYSNGFIVTINQDIDIGGANNPIVNAGSFVSGQWYQITTVGTTNFAGIGATSNTLGAIFLASGVGSGTGQAQALATLTTATNTAAGATGGGGQFAMSATYNMTCDLRAAATVCLNVTGATNMTLSSLRIVGGSTLGGHGLNYAGTGAVTVSGSTLTGGNSNGASINNASTGTISVSDSTLTVTGAGAANAITNSSTGNVSVSTSTITAGATVAINNVSTGSITVSASTLLGGVVNAHCLNNASLGQVTVSGSTLTAGAGGVAIANVTAGTVAVTSSDLVASAFTSAITGASATAVVNLSGNFYDHWQGWPAVYVAKWKLGTAPTLGQHRFALAGTTDSYYNMYGADNGAFGNPIAANVRSGVSYGGGNITGTLAVPLPSQVAVGVATDNTVGTAFVTGSDIATAVWGAATRTITGGTVDTLTNAPASVTPSDIWSHASRTITGGTVDTLTNAPSVPSASAIASQVRSELSVELARVDQAISTRATPANIPSADISAIKSKTDNLPASPAATGDIPTESEIAAVVWAKPTTELTITGSIGERAKNQSTVSTTGAQLAAALS